MSYYEDHNKPKHDADYAYVNNIVVTIVAIIMLLFALLTSKTCAAQEEKFSYIQLGQSAKFTGFLLTPESLSKIMAESDFALDKLSLEYDEKIAKAEAQKKLEIANLDARVLSKTKELELFQDTSKKQIDALNEIIEKCPNRNWYWWLGGGILVGITGAIIIDHFFVK